MILHTEFDPRGSACGCASGQTPRTSRSPGRELRAVLPCAEGFALPNGRLLRVSPPLERCPVADVAGAGKPEAISAGRIKHFRAYAIPVFIRLADPQRRWGYPPILHGTTGFPPLPFRGSSAFTAHYI